MQERLQKIIARAGITSRRKAEELILGGRVRVNGQLVTELGSKADPERDHIKVNNKLIRLEPKEYVAFHKPRGVLSSLSDDRGRPVTSGVYFCHVKAGHLGRGAKVLLVQ